MLNEASLTKNESTDLSHNSKSKINLFTYLDNIINKNLKPTQFLIFQEDNTKTNENKKKQLILYKCERCGKIYSKLYRFQIHLRTHVILILFIIFRLEKSLFAVLFVIKDLMKIPT